MPGLPEAIVDILGNEALACARAESEPARMAPRLAAIAQGNETALRLARGRVLARGRRGTADRAACERAAAALAGALAHLPERPR